jgi:hypothetical protein
MAKKDPKDPSTTSLAFDAMAPLWHKIGTVLEGTEALRAQGEAYTPRHNGEKDHVYRDRLESAVLYNVSEITLDHWVGQPFSEPVALEDAPAPIEELRDDIDLQGSDLSVFARSWFREGLSKAFSHVMVDFPRLRPREDGRPRTVEDDRRERVRPYWIHYPPESVIAMNATMVNGREVLTHVRIIETSIKMDGYVEVPVMRVREYNALPEGGAPVSVRVWEPLPNKKKEWRRIEEFELGVDFIPMVTFYANRTGLMTGKPPLLDLVNLNLRHWQSYSDQCAILTVTRFPILASSGGTSSEGEVKIGPMTMLNMRDPQAKIYYIEHSGAAIAAGKDDIKELEERMAHYGAQFMVRRPGSETATARALDTAESTSQLQDAVMRFEDAMDIALWYTGRWLRIEEAGHGRISKDFQPTMEAADLDALKAARASRDISRVAFLRELQVRQVLSPEFNIEEDEEQLEKESASFGGAAMSDLDPGQDGPGRKDDDDDDEDDEDEEDDKA